MVYAFDRGEEAGDMKEDDGRSKRLRNRSTSRSRLEQAEISATSYMRYISHLLESFLLEFCCVSFRPSLGQLEFAILGLLSDVLNSVLDKHKCKHTMASIVCRRP